jgi:hypothetical protein
MNEYTTQSYSAENRQYNGDQVAIAMAQIEFRAKEAKAIKEAAILLMIEEFRAAAAPLFSALKKLAEKPGAKFTVDDAAENCDGVYVIRAYNPNSCPDTSKHRFVAISTGDGHVGLRDGCYVAFYAESGHVEVGSGGDVDYSANARSLFGVEVRPEKINKKRILDAVVASLVSHGLYTPAI